MVPNPWEKEVEESYDFDVTKADKLFNFLLEKGHIKLPINHVILPPDQLKNKKFCKYHNLLLILLRIVGFFGSIFKGLFSKGSLNLIRLKK